MSEVLARFDFTSDTYALQRRPGHSDLLINDDYSGLAIVDPMSGAVSRRVPFPDSFSSRRTFDSWCLRADGTQAVVFDDIERRACLISLLGNGVEVIEHPRWSTMRGVAFDWRGDTLWMKHPDELRFAVVRTLGERHRLDEVDALRALQENRPWRRSLDRLRRMGGRCMRVEPDRGHLLYVLEDETTIGALSWVEQPLRSMLAPVPPHRVACHEHGLAILQEYEAEWLDEAGNVVSRFAAPDGFHFVDLETVPKPTGDGSALVLIASATTGETLTRFMVLDPAV